MSCRKSLNEIRRDLEPLRDYWVVVYGSYARNQCTPRSDIDVAVITRISDPSKNIRILWKLLPKIKPGYDLRIFELLPLPIKMSVINNHIVIFGDPLDISEYFYFYRKLWKDVEPRYVANQFKSYKEILEGIQRRQKILRARSILHNREKLHSH
ncbi:MAG: nucleotidyltransferase family protein [Candidatus Njordarchaeales archaeon]